MVVGSLNAECRVQSHPWSRDSLHSMFLHNRQILDMKAENQTPKAPSSPKIVEPVSMSDSISDLVGGIYQIRLITPLLSRQTTIHQRHAVVLSFKLSADAQGKEHGEDCQCTYTVTYPPTLSQPSDPFTAFDWVSSVTNEAASSYWSTWRPASGSNSSLQERGESMLDKHNNIGKDSDIGESRNKT